MNGGRPPQRVVGKKTGIKTWCGGGLGEHTAGLESVQFKNASGGRGGKKTSPWGSRGNGPPSLARNAGEKTTNPEPVNTYWSPGR